MTKVINRMGDRMLGMLLGREVAGACVPENGQQCTGCQQTSNCVCLANGDLGCKYATKSFNCQGACSNIHSYCYGGAYVATQTFPGYC